MIAGELSANQPHRGRRDRAPSANRWALSVTTRRGSDVHEGGTMTDFLRWPRPPRLSATGQRRRIKSGRVLLRHAGTSASRPTGRQLSSSSSSAGCLSDLWDYKPDAPPRSAVTSSRSDQRPGIGLTDLLPHREGDRQTGDPAQPDAATRPRPRLPRHDVRPGARPRRLQLDENNNVHPASVRPSPAWQG
jgi:hypothetical protein